MTTGNRVSSKISSYASLFFAAGNSYRIAMLFLLSQKPRTPSEIAARLKISGPLVIHHMDILRSSGWVESERIGLHVFYTVNKSALRQHALFTKKFSS